MNDFYTVSEYAKMFNKHTGNIRRMLARGTIKGEKIGNQWVIPRETEYPKDRRVKSGQYHNWRQKINLNNRHPELLRKLYKMSCDIAAIHEGKISSIVLYGSYAKGTESEESNVDIALFLKEEQTEKQYDILTDVTVDYELDLGITLSIVPIKQVEFTEWKSSIPFFKNIEKEGIVLWKTT